MEFKASMNPTIRLTLDGKVEITLTATRSVLKELESLKDKELNVKITKFTQKRSLSQNAYMWVLINELAVKLGLSKEEVYKNFIRDYGIYEILPIKNEAVDRFVKSWSRFGLGWFVEDIGDSKLQGFTKLMAYYGSSSYNSIEMSRVINAIIDECQEQGITTMSLQDIMLLNNENDSQ